MIATLESKLYNTLIRVGCWVCELGFSGQRRQWRKRNPYDNFLNDYYLNIDDSF